MTAAGEDGARRLGCTAHSLTAPAVTRRLPFPACSGWRAPPAPLRHLVIFIDPHVAMVLAGLPHLSDLRVYGVKDRSDGGAAAWEALPLARLTFLNMTGWPAAALPGICTATLLRELHGFDLDHAHAALVASSLVHLTYLGGSFKGAWPNTPQAPFAGVTLAPLRLGDSFEGPPLRLQRLLPAVQRPALLSFVRPFSAPFYDLSQLVEVRELFLDRDTLAQAPAGALSSLPRLSRLSCDCYDESYTQWRQPFAALTALEELDLTIRGDFAGSPVLDAAGVLADAAQAPAQPVR